MNPSHVRNITPYESGLLVRINRAGLRIRAWVPNTFPGGPLPEAIRLRDKFLNQLGGRTRPHRIKVARSNTGVVGVSETYQWAHNTPLPCFTSALRIGSRRIQKRFIYRTGSQRESAFKAAVAFRRATERQVYAN